MEMLTYASAYIGGGVIALTLLNALWYPAPADLNGVALGLTMGLVFTAGALLACGLVRLILRPAHQQDHDHDR